MGSGAAGTNATNRLQAMLLLAAGMALYLSDPWFSVFDGEWRIADQAAQPLRHTLQLYLSGIDEHEHPALYDILLHGWMRIADGAVHLLRVPSILFFLLGAWALSRAGRRMGGRKGEWWTLVLALLWPFGFHYARAIAWYPFCFMLVALLTLAYLRYLEDGTWASWLFFLLAGLALVYANYFGWVLLGCIAADFFIRHRALYKTRLLPLAGAALILVVAYVPLYRVFFAELHFGVRPLHSVISAGLLGTYNLYCLFVSESVAPWVWVLGVPAGIAIVVCLLVVLFKGSPPAREFLIYFLVLLAVMTVIGIVNPRRIMLIGAWLVLPVAVTLGTLKGQRIRKVLGASLLVVGTIGWYGILARNLYASPRWVEPWEKIARGAAGTARSGGIVIGDNVAFFFYLTYLLPQPGGRFSGLLPLSVHRPHVYDPEQWITSGEPIAPVVFFAAGPRYIVSAAPTNEAKQWLDQHCRLVEEQHFVRNPGTKWKERYVPGIGHDPWRIDLRTYSCAPPAVTGPD